MRKFYNIPENQLIGEGIDSNLYNTYFYVEDISGRDNEVIICKIPKEKIGGHSQYNIILEYSYDSINWIKLPLIDLNGVSIKIQPHGLIYLRGNNNSLSGNNLSCKNEFNIGGNILSLLYGYNFYKKTEVPNLAETFFGFFSGDLIIDTNYNPLVSVKKLLLPTLNPTYQSYDWMFRNTTCVDLPIITALQSSGFLFSYTFGNTFITSVNNPFNFNYVSGGCFNGTFSGCKQLKNVDLSNIKDYYSHSYTFLNLFSTCTSLNFLKIGLMEYDGVSFTNWLRNVSPTGTFLLPVGSSFADNAPRNGSGIPEGWEIKYFNPETDEIIN